MASSSSSSSLVSLFLLALMALLVQALPIVDPGLFVIMGVKTCRSGNGYCILGNNCTLDEDFLPDDRGGHCNGLRSAFTPSAEFICCRYNAEETTPVTTPVTDPPDSPADATITSTTALSSTASPSTSLASISSAMSSSVSSSVTTLATTMTSQEEQVTMTTSQEEQMATAAGDVEHREGDGSTETTAGDGNETRKRTRMDETKEEAEKEFVVTVSEIPPSEKSASSTNITSEQNVSSLVGAASGENKSASSEGGTMHESILKLITEGDWQISFRDNNEVGETTSATDAISETTTPMQSSDADGERTTDLAVTENLLSNDFEKPSGATDVFVEKEIVVGSGDRETSTSAQSGVSSRPEDDCWLVRFVDARFDAFICHGALVDGSAQVLTSAMCAISIFQAGVANVRVRVNHPEARGVESSSVRSIAVHEDFRPTGNLPRHDVGLVKVDWERRSGIGCSISLASPEQQEELNATTSCYTFVGASQGNGDVTRHRCAEIGSQPEEGGRSSLTCSLTANGDQVHSGTPLVCGQSLAGVAFASQRGVAFTPSTELLPWVRWNLQEQKKE